MRQQAFLAAFLAAASRVAAHPLCYDDTPTNLDQVLNFCPEQQDGACCTDLDETEIEARFNAAGVLSDECAGYYTEVRARACSCSSFLSLWLMTDQLGERGQQMRQFLLLGRKMNAGKMVCAWGCGISLSLSLLSISLSLLPETRDIPDLVVETLPFVNQLDIWLSVFVARLIVVQHKGYTAVANSR